MNSNLYFILIVVFGCVLLQRSVYEWIEKLENSRTSVTHEEGAGHPSTATTDDNTEHICDMVLLDIRLTIIEEVAKHLQISHGSAYDIIHNKLGFHIVSVLRIIIDSPTYKKLTGSVL
jgi:hypothetical protein